MRYTLRSTVPPFPLPRRLILITPRFLRLLLPVLALGLAGPAAADGVSCHCFRERSFDAANPTAVDPYLLATTQNSLLAAAFGIPKKAIVRAKMTGADGGQLWVAQFLARSSDRSAGDLLDARGEASSWQEALARAQVAVPEALRSATGDAALAAAVVDQVLAERLGAQPNVLAQLRAAGATDAETVTAVYLGLRAGKAPPELYAAVRSGAASWGSILETTGLAADQIDEDLARRLH